MSSDLIAAENLAKAIRQVAGRARSEEDLRVGVEHARCVAVCPAGALTVRVAGGPHPAPPPSLLGRKSSR